MTVGNVLYLTDDETKISIDVITPDGNHKILIDRNWYEDVILNLKDKNVKMYTWSEASINIWLEEESV